MAEMLNVVNEAGEVIGTETREKIHREGLLHREVHVWLVTPRGELVFQRRAKDKDTFPGLLDCSVGGHVDIGDEWLEAAVREVYEETGLTIQPADLKLLGENRFTAQDAHGRINNVLDRTYALMFGGNIGELKVEAGKADGFELRAIDAILELSPEAEADYIFHYMKPIYPGLFALIKQFVQEQS